MQKDRIFILTFRHLITYFSVYIYNLIITAVIKNNFYNFGGYHMKKRFLSICTMTIAALVTTTMVNTSYAKPIHKAIIIPHLAQKTKMF